MNALISYVNLFAGVWLLILMWSKMSLSDVVKLNSQYYTSGYSFGAPLELYGLVFIVTLTSIYLFFARQRRVARLKAETEILAEKVKQFELKEKLNVLKEGPNEI